MQSFLWLSNIPLCIHNTHSFAACAVERQLDFTGGTWQNFRLQLIGRVAVAHRMQDRQDSAVLPRTLPVGLGTIPPIEQAPLCISLARKQEEGSGTLLQYSCLENTMDGGAW